MSELADRFLAELRAEDDPPGLAEVQATVARLFGARFERNVAAVRAGTRDAAEARAEMRALGSALNRLTDELHIAVEAELARGVAADVDAAASAVHEEAISGVERQTVAGQADDASERATGNLNGGPVFPVSGAKGAFLRKLREAPMASWHDVETEREVLAEVYQCEWHRARARIESGALSTTVARLRLEALAGALLRSDDELRILTDHEWDEAEYRAAPPSSTSFPNLGAESHR